VVAVSLKNDSSEPAWFPDSLRVAFQSNDAESTDIWSVDANDDSRRRAWTKDLLGDYQPAVGPDGSIVFVRALARGRFLHRVTPDDPVPRLVTDAVRSPTTPRFSPEGDRLVVAHARGDLLTMSLAGTGLRRVPIDDMPTATDPDWVASLAVP